MIERHITFSVELAKSGDFERFFAERYAPAMAKAPGYLRVDLLRAQADATNYSMSMRWVDAGAATGWRISPVHQALQPELKALSEMGAILVYDVVA